MIGVSMGSFRRISIQHDVQKFAFRMHGMFWGRFKRTIVKYLKVFYSAWHA